jgi:succinate dehydrogenase cytochrome b subunit
MGWTGNFFSSSIGKKFIMSLTGLFLCLFLIEHLIGNLLLLLNDGGELYNAYSHFLATNIFLRVPEIILALGFIFHIVYALKISLENKKARGNNPYEVKGISKNTDWFSRNMTFLGILILIFLVIHLADFFVKARITGDVQSTLNGEHDLYSMVRARFEVWWFALIYFVAMIALAAHLTHGFQSAFRTLGLRHKKYLPLVKFIGYAFAILVPAGFAIVPVYFLMNTF